MMSSIMRERRTLEPKPLESSDLAYSKKKRTPMGPAVLWCAFATGRKSRPELRNPKD